jgi:type III pantothenate kinase
MLLVIDVGNTHMVLGVYNGSQLLKDWRVHTERSTTEDEFNVLINSLFSVDNIDPISPVWFLPWSPYWMLSAKNI